VRVEPVDHKSNAQTVTYVTHSSTISCKYPEIRVPVMTMLNAYGWGTQSGSTVSVLESLNCAISVLHVALNDDPDRVFVITQTLTVQSACKTWKKLSTILISLPLLHFSTTDCCLACISFRPRQFELSEIHKQKLFICHNIRPITYCT